MKTISLNFSTGSARFLHIYADGKYIEKDNPKFSFVYSYVTTSEKVVQGMNIPKKWDGETEVYTLTPAEFSILSQKISERILLSQTNEIARQTKVSDYVVNNMNYVMPELLKKLKELSLERRIEIANILYNERQHFNQEKYISQGEEGWMSKWWAFQKDILHDLNKKS